jgi:hypothetical protein
VTVRCRGNRPGMLFLPFHCGAPETAANNPGPSLKVATELQDGSPGVSTGAFAFQYPAASPGRANRCGMREGRDRNAERQPPPLGTGDPEAKFRRPALPRRAVEKFRWPTRAGVHRRLAETRQASGTSIQAAAHRRRLLTEKGSQRRATQPRPRTGPRRQRPRTQATR